MAIHRVHREHNDPANTRVTMIVMINPISGRSRHPRNQYCYSTGPAEATFKSRDNDMMAGMGRPILLGTVQRYQPASCDSCCTTSGSPRTWLGSRQHAPAMHIACPAWLSERQRARRAACLPATLPTILHGRLGRGTLRLWFSRACLLCHVRHLSNVCHGPTAL